jgi:hypothetical protein
MQISGVGSGWALIQPGAAAAAGVGADLNDLRAALRGEGDGAPLDPAAKLLGVTTAQLRVELEGGKTLAQIAAAAGTSVSDVEDALLGDVRSKLGAAVDAGQLTQNQAQGVLAAARQQVENLVTGQRRPAAHNPNAALINLGGPTLWELLFANGQQPAIGTTPSLASVLGSLTDLTV